ncbi:peritrophin-44 [Episyrphus balteatus]|uniref:peritrophin-44 n=1 Tax=Episyrphus balteatus TaxID=286459 RepID=UPI002485C4EB|nr:peritrophin-44 [Episyrphus balteatus]
MIALTVNISQVKALSPDQTCKLVQNNTYIADPNNCQGWILCRNGAGTYGTCNDDLYYDSTNGVCDFPQNVNCNTNVETMCSGLTDVYKADPNDCNKYCYCHEGETYCVKCPTGQVYDSVAIKCVWASSSSCIANSPCLLVQNGFMGDGKSCNGWLRCADGQVVSKGVCGTDRYFNPNNGLCDYPQNVKCASNPVGPPGPSVNEDPVAPAGLCKKAGYFYSDNLSCTGYFYCPKANDQGQFGKCPKNSAFSESLQQCVDPDKVVCNKDRCDGVTKSFMAIANTKCMQYYNCRDGASYAQGKCPSGNPYLNEIAGVCQEKKPNYPICN